MPIIPAHNPIASPDFAKGQRTPRPLPPPGHGYDGRVSEDLSAHFAASPQVTTITLGGSTSTGDKTTLAITPIAGPDGSPGAYELGPLTFTFETGATETLDAVGEGLVALAVAAQQVTSVTDLANYQRVRDLVKVTYDDATNKLAIEGRTSTIRFTAALTSTGSVTSTQATTGGDADTLRVGIVGFSDGIDSRFGRKIKAPTSSSTPAEILGVVMDGPGVRPQEAGYTERDYDRGKDVLYRASGSCTAYAEKGVTADAPVYVRTNAGSSEVAGAVTDTATTDTANVWTMTPSVASETTYRLLVKVLDYWTGEEIAEGLLEGTSDDSPQAAEIVSVLKTSLADHNDQLDDYVTGTGDDALVLTASAGYRLACYSVGAGDLAPDETTEAASDHVLWAGAKFLEATTAAGSAPIYIPR